MSRCCYDILCRHGCTVCTIDNPCMNLFSPLVMINIDIDIDDLQGLYPLHYQFLDMFDWNSDA